MDSIFNNSFELTLNDYKLYNSLIEYCKLNDIQDINKFAINCLRQGFNIIKYGLSPLDNIRREKNGIKDFEENNIKTDITNNEKEELNSIGMEENGFKELTSSNTEYKKEEIKPIEEEKKVTKRKIRVIKKKTKQEE